MIAELEAAAVPSEAVLAREEEAAVAVAAAINPATIALFVQIGSSLLTFASSLFGGKTGAALNDIAKAVNAFGSGLLTVSAELQKVLTQVDAAITAIDQTQRSKLAPVHSQVMAYLSAFPNGVPQVAATGNFNYALANDATATTLDYFQSVSRGPIAMMPTLCHASNTRMELAISTWPCWYTQSNAAQPAFTDELNRSSGQLGIYLSGARGSIGGEYNVKAILPKPHPASADGAVGGPGGPPGPPDPIGWQVREGTKVVWQKMDDAAYPEAKKVMQGLKTKRQNEVLGGYIGTLDRWTNMTARLGGAGVARALDVGDAQTFLRFVNPSSLVMEDRDASAAADDEQCVIYRALPMRDVLLDILTSKAMRDRHGLLVQGADKRAVNTWFEKTFFRQPTPNEQAALLRVVELFGANAIFGTLAFSDEYERRFGDGLPSAVDRRPSKPSLPGKL